MKVPERNTEDRVQALSETKRALLAQELMRRRRPEPIYILGAGCRLPGGVRSPDQLWDAVSRGKVMIGNPPRGNFRPAGFLDGTEQFDYGFFRTSRHDAENMDPRQRLLLETSWEAFESAGIVPEHLKSSRVGVFVGAGYPEFFGRQMSLGKEAPLGSSGLNNFLPQRLSYFYDFQGPSLCVDSACTSGMVALQLAAESLRRGESELALVGGVHLLLDDNVEESHRQLVSLSERGEARPYDTDADGMVRGEACVVFVLSSQPQPGAGRPWGELLGIAQVQSGRGNGIVAPSGLAQKRVIREALKNAGVDADTVTHVEGQGSATILGDVIETEALAELYGAVGRKEPCHLRSVRANLGHSEQASGLVSLLRVLLSLRHGWIPPQANFKVANNECGFSDSGLSIKAEGVPWTGKRIAAIHNFGMGGSHVHALVGPGSLKESVSSSRSLNLLVLSAHTPDALDLLQRAYAPLLSPETLPALCASAALGRSALSYRVAYTFEDCESLRDALQGSCSPVYTSPGEAQSFAIVVTPDLDRSVRDAFASMGLFPEEILTSEQAPDTWPRSKPLLVFGDRRRQIPGGVDGFHCSADEDGFAKAVGWLWCHGVRVDWNQLFQNFAWIPLPFLPLRSEVLNIGTSSEGLKQASGPRRVALELDAVGWSQLILNVVRDMLPERCEPDLELSFSEQGLDSLAQLSLHRELEKVSGQRLPRTLVYEHSTISSLAASLSKTDCSHDEPSRVKAPLSWALMTVVWFCLALCLPSTPWGLPDVASHPPYGTYSPEWPGYAFRNWGALKYHFDKWPALSALMDKSLEGALPWKHYMTRLNSRLLFDGLASSPNPSLVKLGKYGFLFIGTAYNLTPGGDGTESEILRETLLHNQEMLASRGIYYLAVATPRKEKVYAEFLPVGYTTAPLKLRAGLHGIKDSQIPVLDLLEPLIQAKVGGKALFERTGVHWNALGAWAGYQLLAARLQESFPDIEPMKLEDVEIGFSQHWGSDQADQIAMEDRLLEYGVSVVPKVRLYRSADSRLQASHNDFLPPLATEIPGSQLPTAVVFRDSMSDKLIPLLSQHFSRVVYLQTDVPTGLSEAVINQESPDIVLHEMVDSQWPFARIDATKLGEIESARPISVEPAGDVEFRLRLPEGERSETELSLEVECPERAVVALVVSGIGQQRRSVKPGGTRLHFNLSDPPNTVEVRWLEGKGSIVSAEVRTRSKQVELSTLFDDSKSLIVPNWLKEPLWLPAASNYIADLSGQLFQNETLRRGYLSTRTLVIPVSLCEPDSIRIMEVVTRSNCEFRLQLACIVNDQSHPQVEFLMAGTNKSYFRIEDEVSQLTLAFNSGRLDASVEVLSIEVRSVPRDNYSYRILPPRTAP